jgi:hypothetical protein
VPGNKCRWARVGNKLASKHEGRAKLTPADLATRDALLDRLFAERGGRHALDIVSQLRVEDYATAQIQLGKVTRRLEMLGAVSTAGNKRSSLVDTYNVFSARVERLAAELPPPRASSRTNGTDDYENLTDDDLIARIEALLKRAHETRDLRLRTEGIAATEKQQAAPVAPTSVVVPADAVPTPRPAPEPAPTCLFCNQSPDACAATKSDRLETWRALHSLHPDEIDRKNAELNQEFRLATGIDRPSLGERRDPFAHLSPEDRARELEAQRVRRELGWERDDGLGTRRG